MVSCMFIKFPSWLTILISRPHAIDYVSAVTITIAIWDALGRLYCDWFIWHSLIGKEHIKNISIDLEIGVWIQILKIFWKTWVSWTLTNFKEF